MSLRDPNVVNPSKRKRASIVIANPTVAATTGWPVGFWGSDPRDAGGYSASDLIRMGFVSAPNLLEKFDAILVAGEQSLMFLFEKAVELQRKFVEFFKAGKLACALCHGVALLRYARLTSGDLLVKGKTVTGFTNAEEDLADDAVWSLNLLARDVIVKALGV